MQPHTKVMGKEWADAQRVASVARLRETLNPLLSGHPSFTFEVGSGHGHWLAAYAAAHPDELCVGIDLITDRVERSKRKQQLGRLTNAAFLKAEATEFLDALPPGHALARIFILYPDPWPKKKHHKNRFVSAENLDRLAKHSPVGARLHFRTDDANYQAWTVQHLNDHPQWEILPEAAWPFEQKTFFEERTKQRRDVIAARVG